MQSKTERKQQIDALLTKLASSSQPEAGWVLELLELSYEDAKERLVDARGEELAVTQGEAQFCGRLQKQLAAASALLKRGARS